MAEPTFAGSGSLARRLVPLYLSTFLGGVALWAPIEKLFLVGIGFDAASVGLMAALYAIVVPLSEVPSGILADRWSRRGVLLLGAAASAGCVIVGALSFNVATYLVSAACLGLYFAMQSGTLDAVAYDTVLEEAGNSDAFEAVIGRLRLVESAALVGSAIAGAWLADLVSLRATYWLTLLPLAGSAVALLSFREPQLHRREHTAGLGDQLRSGFATLTGRGPLRRVVVLLVLASLLIQATLEFGPWWLVELRAPTLAYGLHWGGVTAALGVGGVLGSHPRLAAGRGGLLLTLSAVAALIALSLSGSLPVVILTQVVLTAAMVAISIPLTRRMHDALDSAVRASVASGVGALSWLVFVPFALLLGQLGQQAGAALIGWAMTVVGVATAAIVVGLLRLDTR